MELKQKINFKELFEDWKCLLQRWKQVKDCPELKRKFCNRNRNPLFDVSKTSLFDTGLGSPEGLKSNKPVKDHFIQRTKAVELIFTEMEKSPNLEITGFTKILKKYCSVVKLSKEEHSKISVYCKKNKDAFNYEAYLACGIKVSGLSEFMLQI